MISVILFITAIVVSTLNPYSNLIGIVENASYILVMFIYFINLRWNEGILRKVKQENIRMLAETQLKLFYSKKIKITLVITLVFLKLIFAASILITTINKISMPLAIFKNNFLLDHGMLLAIASIIVETLVVIVFSMKIIKAEERMYVICP